MTWVQLQHTRPVSPLYQRCIEGPPDFLSVLLFQMIVFICLFDNSLLNCVREKKKWLALLHSCSSRWCYKRALLNAPVHKEPNCERRSNPRWCRAYVAQLRRILTHGCCNTWAVRICIVSCIFITKLDIWKRTNFISYLVITLNMKMFWDWYIPISNEDDTSWGNLEIYFVNV